MSFLTNILELGLPFDLRTRQRRPHGALLERT